MNTSEITYVAQSFRVICHPDRTRIIQLLDEEGKLDVTQVQEHLNLHQAETSHHMMALLQFNIVSRTKSGKHRIYSLNRPRLEKIIEYSEALCQRKI